MSTDLRDRTTDPSPEHPEPEKPKPALSVAQVVGGALAAMTAAALGSRLSIAGTVAGAALASVVAAVAGSVYTSSLRRTHDRVSTVWKSRGRPVGTPRDPDDATTTGPVAAVVDETRLDQSPTGSTPLEDTRVGGTGTEGPGADVTHADGREAADEPTPAAARRRIGWKPVLAGALLMFAIAAVALTGLELVTGQALSGGSGTTVGQVAQGKAAPSSKPTAVTPTSEPTASPTGSASSEPSTTPSATATAEPSGTPEPTAGPTSSATAEPSVTAVPTPTATSSGSAPIPSAPTTP